MAEITLDYKELEDVSSYLGKVANKVDEYKLELGKKLTNQFSFVPKSPLSTGNTRTNQANYYVKKKKEQLETKRVKYKNFATAIDNLSANAKAADNRVAKSVNDSRKDFLDAHKNLEGDGWAAFFANLVVDVPVLGWIAEAIGGAVRGVKDLVTNLRYWYEVRGGKEIIDTVLVVAGVVLAIAGLVVAIAAFGPALVAVLGAIAEGALTAALVVKLVTATATVIAAVIGLVNSLTDAAFQFKSNKQEDPAWAAYYGNTNSLPDYLRKETFKSKWLNKYSATIAKTIEITEFVCAAIDIADNISKLYKRSGLKKLFSTDKKFDFAKFKNVVTSKEGWGKIGKSLKHSWKGMVLGDTGGFEGWKKRITRAFTSKETDAWKRVEKIGKVIKTDTLGKINNVVKNTNTVFKGISDGFDFKSTYSLAKDSFGINGKLPKTIYDIYDKTTKAFA